MNRRAAYLLVLSFAVVAEAGAQQYVYPANGQSPEQQQNDEAACYSWAVQQTGVDPANPPTQQAAQRPAPVSLVRQEAPSSAVLWAAMPGRGRQSVLCPRVVGVADRMPTLRITSNSSNKRTPSSNKPPLAKRAPPALKDVVIQLNEH